MLRLRAEHETSLSALDRLPTTLQHGDAGRKNLCAIRGTDGEDMTVALEWGLLGVGVAGEEVADRFAAMHRFVLTRAEEARELIQGLSF
jgi:hypothetical protein